MKAVVINQYGSKEELVEQEVNKPRAEANQVVVKLEATSINPIDWKLREGYLKEMYDWEFPIILGWDVAGVITEIGSNVTKWKVKIEYSVILIQHVSVRMQNIQQLMSTFWQNYLIQSHMRRPRLYLWLV